jgi:hypothetical protein
MQLNPFFFIYKIANSIVVKLENITQIRSWSFLCPKILMW